jgi:hypothetical protein
VIVIGIDIGGPKIKLQIFAANRDKVDLEFFRKLWVLTDVCFRIDGLRGGSSSEDLCRTRAPKDRSWRMPSRAIAA